MITIEEVRAIAMALPGAYEQPSYGDQPSWRTKSRMFTWVREDPEALVVWVAATEEKEALLASDPATFFTIPHYDGTPIVLVDLDVVGHDEAAELITESWRLRASRRLVREYESDGG